jgi:hypothetical protein
MESYFPLPSFLKLTHQYTFVTLQVR